ncbi:hypothetical protein SDRG_09944 [Saprolegnia diclina VS20]|uniref:Uncharacterized protein n=1 Tax=Saprolegnia diclina (strain VS20) TaxID=1156394 RepID=T0RQ70_SAPDV|nr:hypothetical protein SDRG_09944 [Saprolegnia diclina VS20]EQC32192.1 hypothetical protein SDRG_09944 [Saprolegnia diclina VS20]|eukprot:XP_008614133.1 hypothetical protein SDRG_09944 [Saprolegnia diclina VS20]
MMRPILRACVLHSVWLARKDRVFRPEAPAVTPEAAATRTTFLTKLHLHHLMLNTQTMCLFHMMHALRHDAWLRDHLVPACAIHTSAPRLQHGQASPLQPSSTKIS